jgi:1-acyl-sn-glycerol-3-phosphate acyltransferase
MGVWNKNIWGRFSLASLIMNMTVYPGLIVLTLSMILLTPLLWAVTKALTGWPKSKICRYWIWIYGRAWILLISPFAPVRIIGVERFFLPSILVMNHLSFYDTFCMGGLPESEVSFTLKAWPFKMLWFTPFMHAAEYIDLETLHKEESIARCKRILSKGGGILFYPEGHRSRTGEMQRFYSGAFMLAVETNIPILPMCITGSDDFLPPGTLWLNPARIEVRILDPVDPRRFGGEFGHIELRKEVKKNMQETIVRVHAAKSAA